MRSPGAEGGPFSGECYFKIIYDIASPPEHLVLVGDWGCWDGCTAALIHPRKTSYFCMCLVKVIVNALVVLRRAPTSLNLFLRWLKTCYELPHLELVKRNSILRCIHHFIAISFYWSLKRMIPVVDWKGSSVGFGVLQWVIYVHGPGKIKKKRPHFSPIVIERGCRAVVQESNWESKLNFLFLALVLSTR